ncbi:unnamed protein product [Merluccius merluccius]
MWGAGGILSRRSASHHKRPSLHFQNQELLGVKLAFGGAKASVAGVRGSTPGPLLVLDGPQKTHYSAAPCVRVPADTTLLRASNLQLPALKDPRREWD